MKRISAIIGALLAAIAAVLVGASSPASATDFHGTTCPGAPYACVWKEANFNTAGNVNAYFKWKEYFPDGPQHVYAGTGYAVHDNATSMVNDATARTVWMYNGQNCSGGETVPKGPQTYDSTFANDSPISGGLFNDSLDSAAFEDYISACKS